MKAKLLKKIRQRVLIVKDNNKYRVIDFKESERLGGIFEYEFKSISIDDLKSARLIRISYIQENLFKLYNDLKPFYMFKKCKSKRITNVN